MGLTSLEEVLRVVPLKGLRAGLCENCRRKLAPSFLFCPDCASKGHRGLGKHTALAASMSALARDEFA